MSQYQGILEVTTVTPSPYRDIIMTLSDITPHSDIACTCAVDQVANNTRTYALFSQKCYIFSTDLFIAFQLKAS